MFFRVSSREVTPSQELPPHAAEGSIVQTVLNSELHAASHQLEVNGRAARYSTGKFLYS